MSSFPIEIVPEAVTHAKRMLARKGQPGMFIRLGVKGGGCSGLEYVLKMDSKRHEIDQSLTVDGVEFVCDSKSAKFLEGSTLTYSGNLMSGGFQFENPNAKKSCGCGTSFFPKDS